MYLYREAYAAAVYWKHVSVYGGVCSCILRHTHLYSEACVLVNGICTYTSVYTHLFTQLTHTQVVPARSQHKLAVLGDIKDYDKILQVRLLLDLGASCVRALLVYTSLSLSLQHTHTHTHTNTHTHTHTHTHKHTHTHTHTHTHKHTHSLTHSLTHSPPPFVCVCARACACVCVCVSLSAAPLLPPTGPADPAVPRSTLQPRRRSQGPH